MIKDIKIIEEILSSKEKFLENVWSVELELGWTVISSQFTKTERYFASTYDGLGDFYNRYKSRICDRLKLEIRNVEQVDVAFNHGYRVEMYKKYDGYTLYAVMILGMNYLNGGHK